MALLLAGRWPSGMPPAWVTGEAQPWPSAAEQRVQRQKAAIQRRGRSQPEPEPEPEAPAGPSDGRAHPASRKKKRKRRA
jgi:hypothetical protein